MASQKLNLTVDQGTDFSETLIAKNTDGTVQNVTGFSAAGQIRKSFTSDTATNFTVTFGDRTKGEVTISLARAQTSSLPAGRYVYDIELTTDANKRSRLAEGQVTVTQEVTREGAVDFVTEVKITDPQDGAFLVYESANTNWVDTTQIRATSNTVLDVTGTLEADGFSGTGSVTITNFIDDDSFGSANNTNVPTSESIKAYVDATSAGKDALAELVDTTITSPSSGQFIIHDGTDSFDNKSISGDIAITNQGVASITAGSIVNADVNASAGIEISKTALVGGTGITLSGNTLSLTANSALVNLGGDGANTTAILRKDGTFIKNFTAGTGLDLNVDNQFSLSSNAAIINLGYDPSDQARFLRHDGIWSATEQYYGGTGITVTLNSNTDFQEGKDAISLSAGAALTNLGGDNSSGNTVAFLNARGQFTAPIDTDTLYYGGTGIVISDQTGNNVISLETNAALNNLGGAFANNQSSYLFLSANGSFLRPKPIIDAGTGLTLTANTSVFSNNVFSVNTNLSHVVGTGALNSGSISSGFGNIDVGANTVTAGGLDINGNGDVSGNLTVHGDMTVNGTTTTVNSTTLTVDDKNIELGSVTSPSDTTADGGGITLKGSTDKTINWINSTDSWTSSENFELASTKQFRINGNDILSQTQLGSTVLSSSLTSVGTLGSLTVTGPLVQNQISGNIFEVIAPDTGTAVDPIISLHRNSSSPATNDKLGIIKFNGEDSAGNKTEYATIHAEIADPTSDAEYGRLDFGILNNGTVEDPVMTLAPAGILLGSDNDLILGQNGNIQFEGNTTGSSIRTTLYCDDPNTNREIILPNASGTVVLKDSTDTLTNKSIDASQLTGTIDDARIPDVVTSAVQTALTTSTLGGLTMSALGTTTGGAVVFREGTDNGTNAIKLQAPAQVDGAGSFGTLDITFPNAAGTMALTSDLSSFITASSSDTLTNKSIDAGQLTGTIADARIPSGIARDSELSSFITASSSDTLTNKSISGEQINSGTIAAARVATLNQDTTGTAATATLATTVTVTADSTLTDSNLPVVFHDESNGLRDHTGEYGLTYNPSTGFLNSGSLSLISFDTTEGQTENPVLELYRKSGTGLHTASDNDELGAIRFFGINDTANPPSSPAEKIQYGSIYAEIADVSDGTEDGRIRFDAITAGTNAEVLSLEGAGSTFYSDLELSGSLNVSGGITANPTTVVISAANTTYTMEANKKVINTHTGGVNIFKIPSVSTVGQIFTVVNSTTQALTLDKTTNSITLNFASGGSFTALSANSTIASGGVAELVVTGSDTLTIFGGGIS